MTKLTAQVKGSLNITTPGIQIWRIEVSSVWRGVLGFRKVEAAWCCLSPPALPYTLQGAADAPAASSTQTPPCAPPSPLFPMSYLAFLYILVLTDPVVLSCLLSSPCHLSSPCPFPYLSFLDPDVFEFLVFCDAADGTQGHAQ